MPIGEHIVDADATPETKHLLARLRAAASAGLSLIGMDSSTKFGEFMRDHPGGPKDWSKVVDADGTDISDVCGRAPSVYGVDVADIVGDWHGLASCDKEECDRQRADARAQVGRHMRQIHARGGVITLHYHMHSPIDGAPFSAQPSEIWKLVAPSDAGKGCELPSDACCAFDQFREKVDSLVDFLQEMVDDDGNLIPVVLRPFHENNGNWFWWCIPDSCDTEVYASAFRRVWQWLVWYVHDFRGHHALLWATGPNGGIGEGGLTTSENYWRTLPDPMFVDIIGLDRYADYADDEQAALDEVRFLVEEAERLGKVPVVAEAGISPQGDRSLWPDNIWTEHVIGPIKDDPVAKRVAWILLWHNFPNDDDDGGSYFGPHNNHPNAEDFCRVAKRDDILFDRELYSKTSVDEEGE